MTYDPSNEHNPFDKLLRDFQKKHAKTFSKIAEAALASSAPAMQQLSESMVQRTRESGQIDLSGIIGVIPELNLAEDLSYLQTPETTRALNEISRRFADSIQIDPEIIDRLAKEFRDAPPTDWAEAAGRVEEDEAVREAAQEFVEQHPEYAEAIRQNFLDIARQTPYHVSEDKLLWGLKTMGVTAGAVAGSVVGIPWLVFISILIQVMDIPMN